MPFGWIFCVVNMRKEWFCVGVTSYCDQVSEYLFFLIVSSMCSQYVHIVYEDNNNVSSHCWKLICYLDECWHFLRSNYSWRRSDYDTGVILRLWWIFWDSPFPPIVSVYGFLYIQYDLVGCCWNWREMLNFSMMPNDLGSYFLQCGTVLTWADLKISRFWGYTENFSGSMLFTMLGFKFKDFALHSFFLNSSWQTQFLTCNNMHQELFERAK